ncbi:carboxypeptidase regulatory-like domain-containing protein [uncultured Paludibaculum sp.]|uniref:carboxypeptidase regulatory-like domain-containing protein n=1 Tax=uncultured Paludibaculum sp. TaxID=1765020 RepID=UPI002AAB79F9|nr:carboxypeptidase regulatory-like domain-containing protein [uncultured Paludibaculum sp.]
MRKKKRRKRTTIGAKLFVLLLLLALSPVLPAGLLAAGDQRAESAVVAGTVFRDPGFALPGAQLTLTVKTKPEGVKTPKAQKAVSDARGEFAFYVPPRKAQYLVTVKARGHVQQEKVVDVTDSPDRLDVYFQLKPETASESK